MQRLWSSVDLRGLCIGAACGAALHKPVVIASCEQRVGHTREKLPCPVCDWAVSMGDNGTGVCVRAISIDETNF
jgi:enoyl-CoA hydratase/carnithine racemase